MDEFIPECSKRYSFDAEDRQDYQPGWANNRSSHVGLSESVLNAFEYTSEDEIKGAIMHMTRCI